MIPPPPPPRTRPPMIRGGGALQLDCSETLPISQMTGVEEQQMVAGPLGPGSSSLTLAEICRHTSLRFIHSVIHSFVFALHALVR